MWRKIEYLGEVSILVAYEAPSGQKKSGTVKTIRKEDRKNTNRVKEL